MPGINSRDGGFRPEDWRSRSHSRESKERLTQIQIRLIRAYRTLGLSFEEIHNEMNLSVGAAYKYGRVVQPRFSPNESIREVVRTVQSMIADPQEEETRALIPENQIDASPALRSFESESEQPGRINGYDQVKIGRTGTTPIYLDRRMIVNDMTLLAFGGWAINDGYVDVQTWVREVLVKRMEISRMVEGYFGTSDFDELRKEVEQLILSNITARKMILESQHQIAGLRERSLQR